jgi:hypothetical protein
MHEKPGVANAGRAIANERPAAAFAIGLPER